MIRFEITRIGKYRMWKKRDLSFGMETGDGVDFPRLNEEMARSRKLTLYDQMLDLNRGDRRFDDEGRDERMETILMFIEQMAPNGGCLKEIINADFLMNRHLLVRIGELAHVHNARLEFSAVRHNDVIFLREAEPETNFDLTCMRNLRNGLKFEQYMTFEPDGSLPDYDSRVTNSEKFKAVFNSEFTNIIGNDSLRVFYAAEIDAVDEDDQYCEIKTIAPLRYSTFDKHPRVPQFVLQAYFGGVSRIIVGNRLFGHINEIIEITPAELGQKSKPEWDFSHNYATVFHVLKRIKEDLKENGAAMKYTAFPLPYQQKRIKFEDCFKSFPISAKQCDFVPETFINKFC